MNQIATTENCESCACYKPKDRTSGYCRRFPPVRVSAGVSAFATTFHMERCWEFRPVETAADAIGLVPPAASTEAPVGATTAKPVNIGETARETAPQPVSSASVPGMTKAEPAASEPVLTTPQRPKLPRPQGGPVAIAP